jgi:hypothetical protein
VGKGAVRGLALRIDGETNGPQLHFGDRMVAVATLRCGGETDNVTPLRLREHSLERDCREVVALVDDYLPVGGDHILDLFSTNQALDHRHIEPAVRGLLPRSNLPDFLRLDAQEQRELRQPLVEKRAPVDQDQCAAFAVGHEVRANDRLTYAGRRN